MSFKELKRNRGNNISDIIAAATPDTEKKSYVDERIWKPTVDKAGNGYAVIRFLPNGDNWDLPFVRYWDHGFQGPTGQWYIEKSLTSIGQQDPVGEANSKLWATGTDEAKDLVRKRKRRLHYVSNIIVESDPKNPDNEGKVFLYVYGKKIHDKIMDVMQPQFEDETPVDPFDFWEGASLKLKIRQVDGFRNYDKSEFASSEELFDGDDSKLEEVYNSMYNLNEFTDPANFKSYDELAKRFAMVQGESTPTSVQSDLDLSATSEPAPIKSVEESSDAKTDDDDEDTLSYFEGLATQD